MTLGVGDLKALEIGQLYYRLCAFDQATEVLESGLRQAEEERNWTDFGRLFSLLLRIWAERLEFDRVDEWRPRLNKIPRAHQKSTINYVLGIIATYQGKTDEAQHQFREALFKAENVREEAQALFGMASVSSLRQQDEEAERYLQEVETRMQSTIYVDLRVACYILRASILRRQKQYDRAIEQLVMSQRLCQRESNLYMALNTLYGLGCAYLEKGELSKAEDYFQLLENLLNPSGLRHLSQQLMLRKIELDQKKNSCEAMRLIEAGERSLILPNGQRIDFGKQFVLMNLLKLFGEEPGRSVSKEDIVKKVWKEEYHPLRHDNKIHATILRLRKLIERDAKHPTYLLNTQEGYCLNAKVKFSVTGEAQ